MLSSFKTIMGAGTGRLGKVSPLLKILLITYLCALVSSAHKLSSEGKTDEETILSKEEKDDGKGKGKVPIIVKEPAFRPPKLIAIPKGVALAKANAIVSVDRHGRPSPSPSSSPPPSLTNAKIEQPKTTATANKPTTESNATSHLSTSTAHFDARDITYFLESHPAHSIYDPRVYFTDERTSRSMAIMLNEIERLPSKLRFAYVVRVYNELGRKIASKMNYYATEVSAILRKTPDDLGNKPEVSMLVDVIDKAFESKDDVDPHENTELMPGLIIEQLITKDKEKEAVFNSSLAEIATRFSRILYNFYYKSTTSNINIPENLVDPASTLLGEALRMGSKTLINDVSKSDKFQISHEIANYMDRILNMTLENFDHFIKDKVDNNFTLINPDEQQHANSFKSLNPMSDRTGLIGTWNNYLFGNLGTSERVVKLFAALLTRVPPESKSRWINMYISQFNLEIERTLSGFVLMQGMPYTSNSSELYLLDPARSVDIVPNKLPKPRKNYTADKNRIPARCYLAGRRWRLVLTRGLKGFDKANDVVNSIADRISHLKLKMSSKSGNEIYRLCMPRLEVGLRGWGINGDPKIADSQETNKFPLKNPIEHLDRMRDPFISGIKLGYKFGVKIGYNEERNATLELEKAGGFRDNNLKEKIKADAIQLAIASYRKAATIAARKVFEIALHEGYMTAMKISVRAGIKIPAEAGAEMAALRCVSFGGQIGMEAGRSVADTYNSNKENLSDDQRRRIALVGETHGKLAGEVMGEKIGASVGKEAAEEAYRQSITRGGKLTRLRFHLEEYEAGAILAFDYGLKDGKRIASSSTLDPSAPRFFRFHAPMFEKEEHSAAANVGDHWEKDLIPPITPNIIDELRATRNHTAVRGSVKGSYMVAKEVKKGLKRVSYSNITYNLEMFANGFIMNDVAYLTLNGTVNNMGMLHGSLIAKDIFNDRD